jgi:hypothetical protein
MMLPPSVSTHEVYGKHRNPEEIQNMDRMNQELELRAYQYGDPVNEKPGPMPWETSAAEKAQQRSRKPMLRSLILRFVTFFFS